MKVRYLIADDEVHAQRRLERMLEGETWLDRVGSAGDGHSAVRLVNRLRPELLFLDIRMPGLSGLEVLEAIDVTPRVIFTTAHAEHAVAAFELHALDYLLKPFSRARLEQALSRARQPLESSPGFATPRRLADALGQGSVQRIFVRRFGTLVPVAVGDIVRLEVEKDYVVAHANGTGYSLSVALRSLLARLDPRRFVQVHRSHVVNLDHVRAFRTLPGNRMVAEMVDGAEVAVSRRRASELRSLGL